MVDTLLLSSKIICCSAFSSGSLYLQWRQRFSVKRKTILRTSPRMSSDFKHEEEEDNSSVNREIIKVSFFSFLHNAAMPFADLVDGSFLSTLDANSLGAVGVVRASQNSVSKLYNSPLSKTTISLIASASGEQKQDDGKEEEALSSSLPTAVSSALALALLLGSLQAILFVIGAKQILHASGIHKSSAMYLPAMAFMKARAWSAPTSTVWLVATNIFRGLGDASTPLICAILFNIANMVGDYVLIEKMKVGIAGTALGTTLAQFAALFPLLFLLNRRVNFWMKISFKSFGRYLSRYGAAGIFLVGRSMARIAAVSYISRQSVRTRITVGGGPVGSVLVLTISIDILFSQLEYARRPLDLLQQAHTASCIRLACGSPSSTMAFRLQLNPCYLGIWLKILSMEMNCLGS